MNEASANGGLSLRRRLQCKEPYRFKVHNYNKLLLRYQYDPFVNNKQGAIIFSVSDLTLLYDPEVERKFYSDLNYHSNRCPSGR